MVAFLQNGGIMMELWWIVVELFGGYSIMPAGISSESRYNSVIIPPRFQFFQTDDGIWRNYLV
jgi:hypothetical protein